MLKSDILSMKEEEGQESYSWAFEGLFNLHPQDALQCLYETQNHLSLFTESFKERIEIEIEYSRSLIRVSKHLNKHIQPSRPSPLSYLSSAFKVEHEQRARHALQLAEYLHSQVEVPCQTLLAESVRVLRETQRQLKRMMREGQHCEQLYKKNFRKYFRMNQEWEEKLMNKLTTSVLPGTSETYLEKLTGKIMEEKEEKEQLHQKYLESLEEFNGFARKYNQEITHTLRPIEEVGLKSIELEADSLRKVIVSEVNMFKNIEYDLLNISRQMEAVSPPQQMALFQEAQGRLYSNPVLSIYQEGPLAPDRLWIDQKSPCYPSVLEHTLLKLDSPAFPLLLQNKYNSTLRFCLQQAWHQFRGELTAEFMADLEDTVINNPIVEHIVTDNNKTKLNRDQIFSVSFSVVCTLGSFIQPIPLDQLKETEMVQTLSRNLATHHFYRFIAVCALEELLVLLEGSELKEIERERLELSLVCILRESIKAKDVFVIRSGLEIAFSAPVARPLFMGPIREIDEWHQDEYWEAIVFEAAYQEITLLPSGGKTELKEVYIMRQRNIVFSTLTTYCHYMVMLGCEHSQIHSVASRFSHVYFLSEEHRRDLNKTIKSATAKLQELRQRMRKDSEENQEERQRKQSQERNQGEKKLEEQGSGEKKQGELGEKKQEEQEKKETAEEGRAEKNNGKLLQTSEVRPGVPPQKGQSSQVEESLSLMQKDKRSLDSETEPQSKPPKTETNQRPYQTDMNVDGSPEAKSIETKTISEQVSSIKSEIEGQLHNQ